MVPLQSNGNRQDQEEDFDKAANRCTPSPPHPLHPPPEKTKIRSPVLWYRLSTKEMTKQIRLEEYPQTHDGAVDFLRDVFKSMGGTIVPASRPRKTKSSDSLPPRRSLRDSFITDFENACLASHWDSSVIPHPRGNRRYEHQEWAEMIQSHVYPHHSDIDWFEYLEWVQHGGGDECFQEIQADING